MKRLLPWALLLIVVSLAAWLYVGSTTQPGYYGLPVVSCVDPTQPILQNFSFDLQITMAGKNVPLPSTIGHDPGDCLRIIHTDDTSGVVHIQSNSATENYTLGELFNVWHKELASFGRGIKVYVDGLPVGTTNDTPLAASTTISVVYQ